MQRLLRIGLDLLLQSALPIIMWLVLGMVVRPEVANVFSLTYPLQFVFTIFIQIFGVGPNITARRSKDRNVVSTNLLVGAFLIALVVVTLCLNVDWYIGLMNMEPDVYRQFCLYAMVWLGLVCIVSIISQKLYYVGKNKDSNIMNLSLGCINFILIVGLNMVMHAQDAIHLTLAADILIVLFFLLRNVEKRKLSLRLFSNIRNTSFSVIEQLCFFVTYGVGFANSFSYGKIFLDAINFETLTTDAQWDVLGSINDVVKIDLTENKFNYRRTLKNSYKLVLVLMSTTAIMNATLYWYYRPNLFILLALLGVQVLDMMIYPVNSCYWCYMQIMDNRPKHNIAILIIRIGRAACSFIPTGFCTYFGQLFSAIARYIYGRFQCKNARAFRQGKRLSRSRGR